MARSEQSSVLGEEAQRQAKRRTRTVGTKATVTVREGWAVCDGTAQRGQGETLDVDSDTAEQWLAAGWVDRK